MIGCWGTFPDCHNVTWRWVALKFKHPCSTCSHLSDLQLPVPSEYVCLGSFNVKNWIIQSFESKALCSY